MKKRVLLDFFQKLIFKRRLVLCLLVIPLMVASAYAQTISVSGVIKDEGGLPLPGVAVTIKGTTSGTMTNENGQFKLNAPGNGVLQLKYLGFLSQEVAVNNRTSINVTLKEDISRLDEVIVIGYGTAPKRDNAGAISSVSQKTIEERVPVNIFDALQGAAAGVRVAADSGAPGDEAQISIRGVSTISADGGRPLYVVDGVQVDNINGISPNDIKSIEILKDAASTSIYGARAANGVILITTKRGEEGKPRVQLNYIQSYSNLAHKLPQANRLEREGFEQSNLPTRFGLYPIFDDSTAYRRNNDWDYQDLITQTGVRRQVDFSVSGGQKGLTYYTGVQYLDDEGIILSSYNKRFNLRTNVDYNISPKATLATRITFGYQNINRVNDGRVLSQAAQRPASQALYLPDGTPIYDNGGRKNPIEEARLRKDLDGLYTGIIYQSFEYKLSKPLMFHLDGSASLNLDRNRNSVSGLLENTGIGTASESNETIRRLQANAYFSYNKTINNDHTITGTLGANLDESRLNSIRINGSGFITESIETLNALEDLSPAGTNTGATQNALLGFFARAGYNYKGRYILNATIRRDGSSRFGADNRWAYFPSTSFAWRISDEKFMSWSKKFLTDAKFRATWGITGNENIGNFASRNQYVFGEYFYNGVSGVVVSERLGNSGLRWEQQEQADVGLDLTLFGGRLAVSTSYYTKTTKDLLSNQPLPREIGFPDNATINSGSIRNRGVEVEISGYPIRNTTKNFIWQSNVNLGFNRNDITDLPGDEYILNNIFLVREGEEAGRFFGYKALGVYAYDESNAYTPDYTTRLIPQFQRDADGNIFTDKNLRPVLTGYVLPDGTPYTGPVSQLSVDGTISKGGDVIWENLPDANGNYNNTISIEDRQVLGSGIPKLTVGFQNSLSYKKFTFSFFLFGSFGNQIYNELNRGNAQFSSTNVTPFPYIIRNLWKYPGQITDVYSRDRTANNSRPGNSYFLEDGSFIRLQTVRLSYQMPDKIAKRAFMKNLSLYAYSNNLATWTSYSGFDPEVNQRNVLEPGRDVGRYPRRREFGLGLNASF
ncbi:SusC/RagA family TonB-linked outer membrane protein [Pedobacter glucosidilyticus]|uniref:SusC/RagA family TonB-linked outer membrane protein n=1 Tax=Pedobacter glucosidilyticus TaxID=1122941 RepID=UPI0026F11C80|nr:SusC/RagA family TonB-linked outer membrane protein [Pedobacter glucosidilyticus]